MYCGNWNGWRSVGGCIDRTGAGDMFGSTILPMIGYGYAQHEPWSNPRANIWGIKLDDTVETPRLADYPTDKLTRLYLHKVPCDRYSDPDAALYDESFMIELPNSPICYATCARDDFNGDLPPYKYAADIGSFGGARQETFGSFFMPTTFSGQGGVTNFNTSGFLCMHFAKACWNGMRQTHVTYYMTLTTSNIIDVNLPNSDDEINHYLIQVNLDTNAVTVQSIFLVGSGITKEITDGLPKKLRQLLLVLTTYLLGSILFAQPLMMIIQQPAQESLVGPKITGSASIVQASEAYVDYSSGSEWWLVKPTQQVYTDDGELWWIAQKGDRWATGQWGNTEFLDPVAAAQNPNPDLRRKGALLDTEVDRVLVGSGNLPDHARCLCYNRVRGRDLAIFYASDILTNVELEDCPELDPEFYVPGMSRLTQDVWVYDSNRPAGQELFSYYSYGICFDPGDETPTNPSSCVRNQDFVTEDYWASATSSGARNPAFVNVNLDGTAQGIIPTFITADFNDDIYMGSPFFVQKHSGTAGLSPTWEIQAADHWPIINVNPNASCNYDPGTILSVFAPFARRFGRTTYPDGFLTPYFGIIDFRDFAIHPLSDGTIQLRGFMGTEEMSTVDLYANNDYSKLPDEQKGGAASGTDKGMWVQGWTINGPFDRRPHLEPYRIGMDGCYNTEGRTNFEFINEYTMDFKDFFAPLYFGSYEACKLGPNPPYNPDAAASVEASAQPQPFQSPLSRPNWRHPITRLGPTNPFDQNSVEFARVGFGYNGIEHKVMPYWHTSHRMQNFQPGGDSGGSTKNFGPDDYSFEGEEYVYRMWSQKQRPTSGTLLSQVPPFFPFSTAGTSQYCERYLYYNSIDIGSISTGYGNLNSSAATVNCSVFNDPVNPQEPLE